MQIAQILLSRFVQFDKKNFFKKGLTKGKINGKIKAQKVKEIGIMTTMAILRNYGFENKGGNSVVTGTGSLVWGWTVKVTEVEVNNLYAVEYHKWLYDQYGEEVYDRRMVQTVTLDGLYRLISTL